MNKETGMHAHCAQLYKRSGMEQKQQPNTALSFKKGCKKVRPMGNFVRPVVDGTSLTLKLVLLAFVCWLPSNHAALETIWKSPHSEDPFQRPQVLDNQSKLGTILESPWDWYSDSLHRIRVPPSPPPPPPHTVFNGQKYDFSWFMNDMPVLLFLVLLQ